MHHPSKTQPVTVKLTPKQFQVLSTIAAWNGMTYEAAALALLRDNLESFAEPLENVGCDLPGTIDGNAAN